MNAKELAAVTATNSNNLGRLLRGLTMIGILKAEENETYSVTLFGETLVSNGPFSVTNIAQMLTTDFYDVFSCLSDSITTGEPTFDLIYGIPFYDLLHNIPLKRETFFKAMIEFQNEGEKKSITSAVDFTKYHRVVDIGGGNGDFMSHLLSLNKRAIGVLFDKEHVIKQSEKPLVAEYGNRCIPIGGSFFDGVPGDGDCYILQKVLYNWSDDKAIEILRNIRKQMKGETKLFIMEPLFENKHGLAFDFIMMAQMNGTVRSIDQYRSLLLKAQLCINNVLYAKNSLHDIIEVSAIINA